MNALKKDQIERLCDRLSDKEKAGKQILSLSLALLERVDGHLNKNT